MTQVILYGPFERTDSLNDSESSSSLK